MAFIVGAVAAAVGLGAVGTALLHVAVAVGLGFAAKKLTPKPKSGDRGAALNLTIDPAAPRQMIVGETGTAGSLVYWQLSGDDNRRLEMVIALADHECEALSSVWVDGKKKEWDSETGIVSGYNNHLKVRFYSGAPGQAADADLISHSGGRWTSAMVGTSVCYVVVTMWYDEKDFPQGIPKFVFGVNGAKFYDERSDTSVGGSGDQRWSDPATWVYSDNPAVAIAHLVRGFAPGGQKLFGLNASAASVRQSDFAASANACDESVSTKGGDTEKRYACGALFDTTQQNGDIFEALIGAMAGEVVESGGIYRIIAGVAQTPVASVTDADLIAGKPFVSDPKRPRSELVNAVVGSFSDPARSYKAVPLPPRTSSTDETADGGIRLTKTLDLTAVTSRSQAQRIMEVERRRARRQLRAQCTTRAAQFVLEPGDWITFTSDRRGYSSRTFVVDQVSGGQDLTTELSLTETDAEIDDWSTSDEIDDHQSSDLQTAGPSLSSASGFALAAVVIEAADGAQRPGLQATWTSITDPTVVRLDIEFRKVDDTVALSRQIVDPAAATYTWVDGVQSGVSYEARIRPVTQPERTTTWSSWTAASGTTADQIVPVASYSETTNPDNLPPAELSAQEAFELSLVTAVESVLGSVAERVKSAFSSAQQTAEAAISALMLGQDNRARISTEQTIRITQNAALAEQITSVASQTDGVSAAVSVVQGAVSDLEGEVDDVRAYYGVVINANGRLVFLRMDGSEDEGSVIFGTDNFSVVHPDVNGGEPMPMFTLVTDGEGTRAVLSGQLIVDSIMAASGDFGELSAISANLGTVTAGKMQSTDNTFIIDLDNKIISISTEAA